MPKKRKLAFTVHLKNGRGKRKRLNVRAFTRAQAKHFGEFVASRIKEGFRVTQVRPA